MTAMMSPARLLRAVRRYCRAHRITGRQFGNRFAGDGLLTTKLRQGLRLRHPTKAAVIRSVSDGCPKQNKGAE